MLNSIDTHTSNTMLTTIDNPFNPFTQYDEWYAFDVAHGYNTCAYLARVVKDSNDLSEADESLAISHGIDEILKYNILGTYLAVTESNWKDRSKTME